jgi:hypothetical protein
MSIKSAITDRFGKLGELISRHEDFQATFETPQGKRVLKYLMQKSGVVGNNFVAGDPHATSFKEGQRHIVMTILRGVNKDTTELIKQIEQGLSDE